MLLIGVKRPLKRAKMIRKKKRPDGLRMKTVLGYTFTDFMDAISTRYGSRTCYRVFRAGDENNLTYSQLVWNAKASASYLISIGIGKGDKVAIIGESCPEWMTMYLAIVSIGAIAVPVLPDFPSRDMPIGMILRQHICKMKQMMPFQVVKSKKKKEKEKYSLSFSICDI